MNWPGSTLHPREFKTWQSDLPEYLCDKFIFHKPLPDPARFREICPEGKTLILIRNPVQQYISWLCTFAIFDVESRKHKKPPKDPIASALERVLLGFDYVPAADTVWQLEDFASTPEHRLALVSELLEGDTLDHDASVTVSKSRFGWRDGIQPIKQNEYRSILTDAEIAMFDRPDINSAYPNWKDGLEMLMLPDAARIQERTQYTREQAKIRAENMRKRREAKRLERQRVRRAATKR